MYLLLGIHIFTDVQLLQGTICRFVELSARQVAENRGVQCYVRVCKFCFIFPQTHARHIERHVHDMPRPEWSYGPPTSAPLNT
jgi:hypothetical protein